MTHSSSAPLVSIVTPCLNPGERLARCLQSVAEQTYPHVEHLVVDGGSTDGTLDLLRGRGVSFASEPDRGQTHAINKGFARARGDWLGWLNADDALTPRAVELAVAALEVMPAAGWVYGDNDALRAGELQGRAGVPPERLDAETLENGNTVPQAGSLVARWALDRVGSLDEELELAMDYDLWLRLIEAGIAAVYVPEVLAVFEIHEGSKSGSIHRSEFWLEWAIALLRRNRSRGAALMFGRAAAAAAQHAPEPIDRSMLEREIERVTELAAGHDARLDVNALRASAIAQAALFDLHLRPRSYRHLLRPEPWLVPETRSRLVRTVRHGIRRRAATLTG